MISATRMRPSGGGYEFMAPTRFDKLFAGVVLPPAPAYAATADPSTWPRQLHPDETFDADYGQLLEKIYGKGLASPAGFEPASPP